MTGQMLIEIVVAIGIISIILVGASELMTRSLHTASFQKQKDEAASILQKIQNDYKVMRDTDAAIFYANAIDRSSFLCVPEKEYICNVSVSKSVDSVEISVVAEWADGNNTLSVSSVQSLSISAK